MSLPTEWRARLADLLVESVDADRLGEVERLWSAEAKRRRDDARAGLAEIISGEDALHRVRGSLGHKN